MDRKTALTLENIAVCLGMISFFVLLVSATFFFVASANRDFSGGALTAAALSAALLVASRIAYSKCQPVLEAQFVEHEGVIASIGATKEQNGVVTFGDGYVAELDFALAVEPGSHLTIWRDGWDSLKRIEVKRPQS